MAKGYSRLGSGCINLSGGSETLNRRKRMWEIKFFDKMRYFG
jgi:hypothetical protein